MATDADLRRIHDRLDAIAEDLGKIKEGLAERKGVARTCQEMNERHERILAGYNGATGLVAEVRAIVDDKKQRMGSLRRWQAAVISLATALLVVLLEYILRLN